MQSQFSISKIKSDLYTLLFLLLIGMILTHSGYSLYYALNGLNLWFQKMIPTLLPFMIISGIMVRLKVTEKVASVLHSFLSPVLRVRKNVTYAIIMGFLCGFPMGARVTRDLLDRNMITSREGEFLLAFCNNIGPVYFLGFVLPVLRRELIGPYVFGMYGIPLLYGVILRHTVYKELLVVPPTFITENNDSHSSKTLHLLEQLDDSIHSAIQSIVMLGGYMILFNLLNLVPHVISEIMSKLWPSQTNVSGWSLILAPILEITGGIGMLGDSMPLFIFLLLPLGSLSCIAQTYSIVRQSSLSLRTYIRHKIIWIFLTAAYYLAWSLLSPQTFLL